MHRTSRTQLAIVTLLSASALACDGTVEPATAASPSTGLDAAIPSDPLTPVVAPTGDAGARSGAADGGRSSGSPSAEGGDGSATEGVPLFVAIGNEGRTLVSCDDGASWVADKSDHDTPCSGSPCDHSATVPTGLAYADGRWFAARGWGEPGPVSYSDDGETWTATMLPGGSSGWSGIAATRGLVFVAGTAYVQHHASVDRGATYEARPAIVFPGHVRSDAYFIDGKLWLISDGGEARTSTDQGRSWTTVREVDARCFRQTQFMQGGLAYDGKDQLVYVNGLSGVVCRSTDRGASFRVAAELGAEATTPVHFADGQFWVWTRNRLRRSRDGATWSDERTTASSLKPVARSDAGTWVAVNDGSQQDQQMLRSRDGITWDALPSSAFRPGHRIRSIVFGHGKKPRACQ